MRTKAFHAFEQKLSYFNDDLELIDVIRTGILKGDLTDSTSSNVLKHVNYTKHKHLSRRQNSDGSRKLIINHLRKTLYSSYVKDVYEEVTQYLKTILEQAVENGFQAGRIIGEHSTKIDAKSVLETGSWENVTRLIADSVFQHLEAEKSTISLLKKIRDKLDLKFDEALINKSLPYLEVRHFLVHADGKVSDEFKRKYGHIKTDNKGFIELNYNFICQMRDSVRTLITAYDEAVISSNLLKPEHTQP